MPIVDEGRIQSLLADGRITSLTVDTNIFDEKRLHLNSKTLQVLASLKDEPISFVLPATVVNEVSAHIEKAAEDALRLAKKGIGQALFAFETEEPKRDDLINRISGGRSASQAARERLDKYIEDTGCEVLEDTALVDISTVFEGYFSGHPPFGSGRKKAEFPDALALHALERIAVDRDISMLVVSKDGDWRAFCSESSRLYLVPEIEKALALINNAQLGLRRAILTWMGENGEGRQEIGRKIEHNIEQIEFTASADASSGAVETMAWNGTLMSIEWPDDADIDIIDTETNDAGEVLEVVVSLPLQLIVKVPIELNFSVWDSIDKESVGMGGRTVEVDEKLEVRATITLNIQDQGTDHEDIIYQGSELDIGYHEIELGQVDVFEHDDYWQEDED